MSTKIRLGVAGACIVALGLVVGLGGSAAGSNGHQYGKLAAKSCAKERKSLGRSLFAQTWGKPAVPNCIAVTKGKARQATRSAQADCRSERSDMGVDAFRDKYGSNDNKQNAFGKCVSGKVRHELAEDRQDTINAAKQCAAERADIGVDAFRDKYGTNHNKRNAFGKCVSGIAKNKHLQHPTGPTGPTGPSGPTGPTS